MQGLGKDSTREQRQNILGSIENQLPKGPDAQNAFLQGVKPDAHTVPEAAPSPDNIQRDFQRGLQQNLKMPSHQVPGALGCLYI